jgi:hypothetical protein
MHQSVLDRAARLAPCRSVAFIAAVHTGGGKTFLPNVGHGMRMAKWDTESSARRLRAAKCFRFACPTTPSVSRRHRLARHAWLEAHLTGFSILPAGASAPLTRPCPL